MELECYIEAHVLKSIIFASLCDFLDDSRCDLQNDKNIFQIVISVNNQYLSVSVLLKHNREGLYCLNIKWWRIINKKVLGYLLLPLIQ